MSPSKQNIQSLFFGLPQNIETLFLRLSMNSSEGLSDFRYGDELLEAVGRRDVLWLIRVTKLLHQELCLYDIVTLNFVLLLCFLFKLTLCVCVCISVCVCIV